MTLTQCYLCDPPTTLTTHGNPCKQEAQDYCPTCQCHVSTATE